MAKFWKRIVDTIAGVNGMNDGYYDDGEGDEYYEGEEGYEESYPPVIEEEENYIPSVPDTSYQTPEITRPIVLPRNVRATDTQVVILQPDSIRSSQQVCDHIRAGHTVICNIENVDRSVAQRVIDYISGAAYSIDGNVKPIDQNRKTFVVAPSTVSLMDRDALAKQEEEQNQANNYRQAL
ncbi:MAG: cell division protein SepF [Clostridiales bacterium]|nr:cell division protein SepF [Clostridiales bacterium]